MPIILRYSNDDLRKFTRDVSAISISTDEPLTRSKIFGFATIVELTRHAGGIVFQNCETFLLVKLHALYKNFTV